MTGEGRVLYVRLSADLARDLEQLRRDQSRRLHISMSTSDLVRKLIREALTREPRSGPQKSGACNPWSDSAIGLYGQPAATRDT